MAWSNNSRRCCVSGCLTEAHNPRDTNTRLFRFVKRANARSTNSEFKELTERRFWTWISVLEQDPWKSKSLWVCSRHFKTGRPSATSRYWETDWIPNQKLRKKKPSVYDRSIRMSNGNEHEYSDNESGPFIRIFQGEVSFSNQEGPLCRLCLRKNANLRPVYPSPRVDENQMVKVIELITNICLNFEDDYNSFVCCDCLNKLDEFCRYREIWQSNDALLRAFRNKENHITPVPSEQLTEMHELNGEDHETCYAEERGFALEPIPIVSIPIEHLLEGTAAGCAEDDNLEPLSFKFEDQQNTTAFDESLDTKDYIESLSVVQYAAEENCTISTNVKQEAPLEIDSDTVEEEQKDRLIRKLMKQIRRETLSPKRSRKSGKRHKKHRKSNNTGLNTIDLTDST
ncbi:uncharacterized protein LOC134205179 [Armigeres subalbatus]|uniref:uncharacterized protein LOC134205179 n=1 Tax=Armigeres subalbatus TaxID=124917 RepID=UPI002ED2E5E0